MGSWYENDRMVERLLPSTGQLARTFREPSVGFRQQFSATRPWIATLARKPFTSGVLSRDAWLHGLRDKPLRRTPSLQYVLRSNRHAVPFGKTPAALVGFPKSIHTLAGRKPGRQKPMLKVFWTLHVPRNLW